MTTTPYNDTKWQWPLVKAHLLGIWTHDNFLLLVLFRLVFSSLQQLRLKLFELHLKTKGRTKGDLWGLLLCEAPRKWASPYDELEPGHRSPVGGVELRESRNRDRDYVILNN